MPAGRPPKPLEEKYRLGNPGKRALPDRASLAVLPGAPRDTPPNPLRPLGNTGRHMWNRIWTCGAVWLAKNVDIESVQILCEQMDERQALRVRVLTNGDWRERAGLRAIDAQVMAALAQLGFNPVERSRLGVAEVVGESTLERLRRERAAGGRE